jgi:hypothetical protein
VLTHKGCKNKKMSPAETLPKDSHEVKKPSGSEVVDEFIERRNNLPKQIDEQQKQLDLSKKELETYEAEWKSLGGDRIDAAQAAVDALNFKSNSEDHVRAKAELRDAKDAFYANMQKQSVEQPASDEPYSSEYANTGGELPPLPPESPSEQLPVTPAMPSVQPEQHFTPPPSETQSETDKKEDGIGTQGELIDSEGKINPEAASNDHEKMIAAAEQSNAEFLRLVRERLADSERASDTAPDKVAEAEAANDRLAPPAPATAQEAGTTTAPPAAEGGEGADYRSSLANALENMARNLSNRAENLEERGGVKGIALRMIKRMGRGAYKLSGLENEVRGMRRTAESVKNRLDTATENRARRKENRQERKTQRKQARQEKAQAKLEKQVKEYQDYLKKKEEARARKTARKEARKQARGEVWDATKELGGAMKEYIGTTRAARFGRGTLNQFRGAWGYARGAAGAMHQAGIAERQNRMSA